jgi:integrase
MLTVKEIDNAKVGMHADGQGLYLQVTSAGKEEGFESAVRLRKSWIYRYQLGGRRREMGLGPLAAVPAKKARELAGDARKLISTGVDPLEQRRREEQAAAALASAAKPMTFKQAARDYIARHESGWRNAKHAQQWTNTLTTYAFPVMGNAPVAEVDDEMVLAVLQPIWHTRTETATRVRSRIEIVLDAARAAKQRTGDNPARWKGHLALLLPKPRKVTPVQHHPALPYAEVSKFMGKLRERTGMSALCLELLVLTAVRSGEALKAEWVEFDREARLWTVPASRTKTGREHRVPLSTAAIALLERAAEMRAGDYVFPGVQSGRPMSDMALTMLLRDLRPGITVHGFRSTFRDWAAEKTSYANELAEMALGHAVGDAVEAAYRRGDMFERRRQLMEDWATCCDAPHQR